MKDQKNRLLKIILGTTLILISYSFSSAQISCISKFNNLSSSLDTIKNLKDFKSYNIYKLPIVSNNGKPILTIKSPEIGIFCKAENKIQKTSNIPFRFRLGSVQYVDYMESKSTSFYKSH